MDKHYGQIVEFVVRRTGYNISTLSNRLNVNRRSIYNWFNNKYLKEDIILKIGIIIQHDFSKEFPELFSPVDFQPINYATKEINETFKDKYIALLEEHTKLLSNQMKSTTSAQLS
jgi:hypothetical protein